MDARARRQMLLLGVLVVALAGVLWWNLAPNPDAPAGPRTRGARAAARQTAGTGPVEKVRLDALVAPRPEPSARGRDPFRFRPVYDPPPQPSARDRASAVPTPVVEEPLAPPGPPPIPLRYIGVMRLPQSGRLIAVLSDGQGVYRGSEGDIIEGRYRIVRLRPEQVELAYVDGRGHQVIRLSGS